jgi:hypothetical protein
MNVIGALEPSSRPRVCGRAEAHPDVIRLFIIDP